MHAENINYFNNTFSLNNSYILKNAIRKENLVIFEFNRRINHKRVIFIFVSIENFFFKGHIFSDVEIQSLIYTKVYFT